MVKITNAKDPKKVVNFVRRNFDDSICKSLYGNVAGLKHNREGRKNISKNKTKIILDASMNEQIKKLEKDAVLVLGKPYDDSLIRIIREKYLKLIENDESSFIRTEYKGTAYSRQTKWDHKDIPELSQLLNDDIIKLIEGYYGSHFQVKYLICWRNYHVPPKVVSESETFSDRWHCDRRNTDIFKLFVNLSDVTEKDGPFHIMSIPRTKEVIDLGFGNRHKYKISSKILDDPSKISRAIGPAGTAMLCNTELCLHKAGIPEKEHMRDIIQFQFVPSKEPLQKNWIEKIEVKPNEMRNSENNPSIT